MNLVRLLLVEPGLDGFGQTHIVTASGNRQTLSALLLSGLGSSSPSAGSTVDSTNLEKTEQLLATQETAF